MNHLLLLTTLLFSTAVLNATANAQETEEPVEPVEREVITLWPEGLPDGANPIAEDRAEELMAKQTDERITIVQSPTLTVYPAPAENASRCAVVICPGGGYNILAWPKEGLELAEWFNSIGVTAFVLKYRVPRRDRVLHREPLQDLQRAIRIVRSRAGDYEIDPQRIGVLGFSAGGHLALMAGFHFAVNSYPPADEIDTHSARPDFLCPIYAAYLGDDYSDDTAELGHLVEVTEQTPPCFLAVTADDRMRGAQSALLFAELIRNNVPAELHAYAKGGHGYGIRPSDNPCSTWHHRLEQWMQASGLLTR